MPISLEFGFPLFITIELVESCSGLSLQLQVQYRESKEGLSCSCRTCPHCSSNTQAGQPLQFAKFSSACFEFNPRPPHSGSIGNCGFYSHSVYPMHHLCSQSPVSAEYCLYRSKGLYSPCSLPYTAASSKLAVCLKLVQGT
jgi:hypothetical protein